MDENANMNFIPLEESVFFVNSHYFKELDRTHNVTKHKPKKESIGIGWAKKKPHKVLSLHDF